MICSKNLVWFAGLYVTPITIGFVFGNNRSMILVLPFRTMLNHLVQAQNHKRCCLISDIVSDIPITGTLEFLEICRNSSNFW